MKKKILIVDDEKPICDMLKRFLTKEGYTAITALSGEECISKVKEEKPHIVLLDIKMPEMDGMETLKRIRKFDKKVGVIIITVVKEDPVGRKCMELGAYDFITKPFDLNYLEEVLTIKLLGFEKKDKKD